MRGSAAFRTGVAPGGALAGPWVRNPLWRTARAVPSLDLDFAGLKSLKDGISNQDLITHTRASSATFVDSSGVLRSAVTNLVLQSEDFGTTWFLTSATLSANAIAAPNGSLTAEQLIEAATTANHEVSQTFASPIANATYTLSCYLKAATSTTCGIRFSNGLNGTGIICSVDLTAQTATVTAGTGTATITNVGSGWFRVSLTATASGTPASTTVNIFRSIGTAGSIANSIYIWGAQLEQASTVGEYVPTTSAVNSAPRFDHNPTTGESLGLLVEEARTNLVQQSADISNAYWVKAETTVTANAIAAPDGTTTAGKLIESTANSQHTLASAAITWAGNTQYTFTFYAKAGERSKFDLLLGTAGNWVNSERVAAFDLSNGTILIAPNSPAVASITPAGNGWYRCRMTATTVAAPAASAAFIRMYDNANLSSYTGTAGFGLYFWGAQLEAGAFPTSYIPTTTATATRAADVASITGSNFSSWYNQTEGTVFVEGSGLTTTPRWGSFNSVAAFSECINFGSVTGGLAELTVRTPTTTTAVSITAGNTLQAGAIAKDAFRYAVNDFAVTRNGVTPSTSTSGNLPNTRNTLYIGISANTFSYHNGHIRRLVYWGQRLPNTTLQQITQP